MTESHMNFNDKANSISADMELFHSITYSPQDASHPQALNINHLSNLLKFKNSKYEYNQQLRNSSLEWSRTKGADLKPLVERIETIKGEAIKEQQKNKNSEQCFFYMPPLSLENQEEYIKKNFEFGIFSAMQNVMKKSSRGSLTRRILNKKFEEREEGIGGNKGNWKIELPIISAQIRSQERKEVYINAVKKFLETEKEVQSNKWIPYFRSSVRQQFWDILYGQCIGPSNSQIHMAIQSLKLVEAEFNSLLPSNYQSMVYYLTKKYTNKLDKDQYESDSQTGPIWGIPYLLYQAGRKEDFYAILRDQDLKNDFREVDQSLKDGKPKKVQRAETNRDVFHDQLIYALRGSPQFAHESFCDINALQFAWIVLRTVGVMGNTQKFNQLRCELFKNYKGPLMDEKKVKNMLYLLMFTEIAELGQNQIMNQDDFLHFLIAIYHSKDILKNSNQYQTVERKLTEELVEYIHELLLEKKNDAVLNYIYLMPEKSIPFEISSIIASSQLIETISWGNLRQRLEGQIYEQLVKQTLEKYIAMHQNYLLVAKKSCELLKNEQMAIEHIIDLFIISAHKNRINTEELERGDKYGRQIMDKNYELKEQYEPVFKFFQDYRLLNKLIFQRDEKKLYSFIRNTNFILITENLKLDQRAVMEELIKKGSIGFDIYIKFIKNLVKGLEISLIPMNWISQLKEMEDMILSALNGLMGIEPYSQFSNSKSVMELIDILNVALGAF